MIAIDASVFVSALLPEDAHHQTSLEFISGLMERGDQAVAPALVLCEVASAVSRRTGRRDLAREAAADVRGFVFLTLISVDARLAEDAASVAADRGFRGADATYVAVAIEHAERLVTWDRDQATRADGLVAAGPPTT